MRPPDDVVQKILRAVHAQIGPLTGGENLVITSAVHATLDLLADGVVEQPGRRWLIASV